MEKGKERETQALLSFEPGWRVTEHPLAQLTQLRPQGKASSHLLLCVLKTRLLWRYGVCVTPDLREWGGGWIWVAGILGKKQKTKLIKLSSPFSDLWQLMLCGAEMACSSKNYRSMNKINDCCCKPLSFGGGLSCWIPCACLLEWRSL